MQKVNHTSVYTIIVTYNGENYIKKCLGNLEKSNFQTHILVIDNASTDNTVNIINKDFPGVECITNKENKGFGMANNTGMQIALQRNADYVFLLNQDAYIEKDTLEKIFKMAQSHPDYGIICPVQLNGKGIGLDSRFKVYLSRVLKEKELQEVEQKQNDLEKIIAVRFANAAAWLIPAQVLKKVGLFHRLFFHYGEDNNFSARMQYHHYKVGVVLNAFVCHDRPAVSTDKEKDLLRKIKTVIRYTATDPRKSFAPAYLQAWYKYFGFYKKAGKKIVFKETLEAEKNFLKNIPALKKLREEMKQTVL